MRMTEAEVVLDFDGPRQAIAIFNSLKPEATLPPTRRSRVEIQRRKKSIRIRFVARDVVALRASMNSILRYVLAVWKTTSSLKELQREL